MVGGISMELGDDKDGRIWELMVVGLVFGGCIWELEFSADKEHEPKCDVIALSDEASARVALELEVETVGLDT